MTLSRDDASARFIRHCLAARWDARALDAARALRETADQDALLEALRAGGVGPLIYAVTQGRDVLPPAVEDEARLAYYRVARSNLLRFRELGRVLRALEDAGIPALVLKGAALASAVYESLGARPMCDADLLVRERDVPAALALLKGLGYRIIPPLTYRCEVMLRKGGEDVQVLELHWNLFVVPRYLYRLPLDWFWETARAFDLEGVPARMLGPEAQVLHLCGHLFLHHLASSTPRWLWLYDIAAWIDSFGDQIDWDVCLDQARRCDLAFAVKETLGAVLDRWPDLVPDPVAAQLCAHSCALNPSPDEMRVIERLRAGHGSRAQRFLGELADLPGGRARRHFVWRNLFPPMAYMRQIYGVRRRWLVPLYYPYRWWLGLRGLVFRKRWNV